MSIYLTSIWKSKHDIAKTMAVYSGFTEGVQLFSSFAILTQLSET